MLYPILYYIKDSTSFWIGKNELSFMKQFLLYSQTQLHVLKISFKYFSFKHSTINSVLIYVISYFIFNICFSHNRWTCTFLWSLLDLHFLWKIFTLNIISVYNHFNLFQSSQKYYFLFLPAVTAFCGGFQYSYI